MKSITNLIIGFAIVFSTVANEATAANFTADVNGWGYSEIRQSTLLPVLVPLGAAAIMMTVAYLVNESSSGNHHHHHAH